MKISRILTQGIATLLPFTPLLTYATQDTLSGAGGAVQPGLSWATIGGWSLGAIPTAADNAVITATGLIDLRGSALGGSTTIQDLTFSSTAAATLNNNSDTTDMLLILNGTRGAGVPLISTTADAAYTIAGPGTNAVPHALGIRLEASGNINVVGTTGTNALTISAAISESGGARSLTKIGSGRMVLSGANTFSGGLNVNGGVVAAESAGAVGTGTVFVSGTSGVGGTLALQSVTLTNALTLNGGTLTTGSTDTSIYAGAVSVLANSAIALQNYAATASDQSLTISGLLSGNSGLSIRGNVSNATSGKALILTNTGNTYSGAYSLESGQTLRNAPAATGRTIGAGSLNFNGGTLQLRDNGTASGVVINYGNTLVITNASATVDVDRVSANTGNTFQLGTVTMGTQTLNVTGANGYGLRLGGVTLVGNATFNPTTAPLLIAGNVSGSSTITKTGAGDLTLSGTNTLTGQTNITGGTLKLTGSLASSPRIAVQSGGTFDVSGTSFTLGSTRALAGTGNVVGPVTIGNGGKLEPGDATGIGTLTFQTLTLGTAAGHTATVLVNTNGIPSRINVSGVLTANGGAGSVVFNFTNPYPALGQNPLIDYTGTIGGTGFSAFVLNPLESRVTATLVNNVANTSIDLNVTAVDFPIWTGGLGSEWSTAALANPKNWILGVAGTGTDYLNGDNVLFNDTATTTAADLSVNDVTPSAVTFTNTTKNFTVTGSKAIIGTTAFTKNGTGKVTVSNVNSFTGAVTVNGGTLSVNSIADTGTNSALGAGASVALNGGTLEFAGATATSNRAVSFSASGGTLKTDTTLTLTGPLSGAGSLTKTGTGTLILTGVGNTYVNTVISAGTLQVGDGGSIAAAVTGTTGSGSITDNGVLAFNHSNAVSLSLAIGGTGSFQKTGSGVLTLAGGSANSFTGTTTVSGGTLVMGKTSGINAFGGNLVVEAGGIVAYSATAGQLQDHIANTATITLNGGTFGSAVGVTPEAPTAGVTETVANVTVNSGAFLSGRGPGATPVIPTPFTATGLFKVLGGTVLVSRGGGLSAGTLQIAAPGVVNLDGGSNTISNESRLSVGAGGLSLTDATINFNAGPSAIIAASKGSMVTLSGNVTSTGTSSFVRQNGAVVGPIARIDLNGAARTFNVTGTLNIGTINEPVSIENGTLLKTGTGTLNINGPQTYTALNTSGGTTNLYTMLGIGTSSVVANGNTKFFAAQKLTTLTVGPGAILTFGANPGQAPAFSELAAVVFVPEPGSGLLLLAGCGTVLGLRRRRAAKSAG